MDLGIAMSDLPTQNGFYAAISLADLDDEIEILYWIKKKFIFNIYIYYKNTLFNLVNF